MNFGRFSSPWIDELAGLRFSPGFRELATCCPRLLYQNLRDVKVLFEETYLRPKIAVGTLSSSPQKHWGVGWVTVR